MARSDLQVVMTLDSKDVEKNVKKVEKTFRQSFVNIEAGISLATRAVEALKRAYDFSREAAEFQRLEQSGNRLATSMGQNMDRIVAAMRKGSQGTLSELQMVQAANRALQLGVAQTPAEFEKLASSAITLGRAMGRSAGEAIEDLTTGIGRMSPLILDNLGILTQGGKVFEDYAKKVGKASSALTEAEKKQALLNAAVDSASGMGGPTEDAAASYERLDAAISDLKIMLGESLVPAMATVAEAVAEIARENVELAEATEYMGAHMSHAFDATGERMILLRDGTRVTKEEFLDLYLAQRKNLEIMGEYESRIEQHADGFRSTLAPAVLSAEDAYRDANIAAYNLAETMNVGLSGAIEQFQEKMKFFAAGGGELMLAFDAIKERADAGLITPQQAELMSRNVLTQVYLIEEEIGKIDAETAAENISENLNVPLAHGMEIVQGIDQSIRGLPARRTVEIHFQATGDTWAGRSGSASRRQWGGPLAPVTLVGEAGPELIVGGNVIPAHKTRSLLRAGLVPTSRFQTGGPLIEGMYGSVQAARGGLPSFTRSFYQLIQEADTTMREIRDDQAASTTTYIPLPASTTTGGGGGSREAADQFKQELTQDIGRTVQQAMVTAVSGQLETFQAQMMAMQQQVNVQTRILYAIEALADATEMRDIMVESKETSGF